MSKFDQIRNGTYEPCGGPSLRDQDHKRILWLAMKYFRSGEAGPDDVVRFMECWEQLENHDGWSLDSFYNGWCAALGITP